MFITTTCISGLDSYNHRRRNAYNTTCSIRCIKTCLYITGLVRSLNGVSGHFSNISFEQLTSISLNLHYYECWMGPCQFILVGISTTGCVFLDGGPFVFSYSDGSWTFSIAKWNVSVPFLQDRKCRHTYYAVDISIGSQHRICNVLTNANKRPALRDRTKVEVDK